MSEWLGCFWRLCGYFLHSIMPQKDFCHLITWTWGDGALGGDLIALAAALALFTSPHPLVSV